MRTVPSLLSPFTHPTLPLWHATLPAGPSPGDSPFSRLLWCPPTHPGIPPTLLLHLPLPLLGFPGGTSSKEPVCQRREDHLEKGMATDSSIPAWRIPWTEEPGRLQSTGLQRVGHDWSNLALPLLGLEDPSPLNSALCTIHYPHALRHLRSSVLSVQLYVQFPTTSLVKIKPIFPLACSIFPFISSAPLYPRWNLTPFLQKPDSCPQTSKLFFLELLLLFSFS